MLGPIQTLAQLFLRTVAFNKAEHLVFRERGRGTRPVSSAEFHRRVGRVHVELKRIGLRRGERCALLSESRWEWLVTDLALATAGIVSVPLDPDLSSEQVAYAIRQSGSRSILVSGGRQREKVTTLWKRLPNLDSVVVFEGPPGGATRRLFAFSQLAGVDPLNSLERGDLETSLAAVGADDPASILYRFAGTDEPQGVTVTQAELVSRALACEIELRTDDVLLSYLPLFEPAGRALMHASCLRGAGIAFGDPAESELAALGRTRPTVVCAGNQWLEGAVRGLLGVLQELPPQRRRLSRWALRVGAAAMQFGSTGRQPPVGLQVEKALAHRLALSELSDRLGGRLRQVVCAGDEVRGEVAGWFQAVGVRVRQGKGLGAGMVATQGLNGQDTLASGGVGRTEPRKPSAKEPGAETPAKLVGRKQPEVRRPEVTAPAWDNIPADEREIHRKAQRFARVLVTDLEEYNRQETEKGRRAGNLYGLLAGEIDERRQSYRRKYGALSVDYFHLELVRGLAEGREAALGPDYPGPMA